jgi:hypothetical protein
MDDCHRSPLCRFKACCNPEHLFWDTHANNCKRRELEKRARQAAKVLIDQMANDTTSDALRANISETLPVVVINEQGEEEKNKDEQEFSWCCLRGRGWRGTKRRRA